LSDIQEYNEKAKQYSEYWREIFDKHKEDLEFLSDEPNSQWDAQDAKSRRLAGKPVLQIDQLSQFVNQVSNDIRMNTPSIEVIAADGGDVETAEIIEGKIREILVRSNADDAFDTAANFAVKSSIGFFRLDHDYIDQTSFNQEIFIDRVINPASVLIDPNSIEPDGSDMKCAFVFDKMHKEEFKKDYPSFDPVSFQIDGVDCEDDYIIVAEYFEIEEEPYWIAIDDFGQQIESDKEPEFEKKRKTSRRIVKRYKLSGRDILKETTFPAEYIPIVPVYGEESWVDGKRNLLSLIRRSKQAQQLHNYWASTEAELLMKAPKAHITAVEGTVEDYAEDWTNPDKAAVLRYKGTDASGRPANPPQFTPPVQIPSGIVQARQQSVMDIRSTMGLYDSFLGQQDNAISGIAIGNRQREGDRVVYHFADNLTRAIRHAGRIMYSMISRIHNEPQIAQIIGKEETNDRVGINGELVEGQERHYYLTNGSYTIQVVTGASYATMRQEASAFFEKVLTTQPQLMNVMGDLMFKYSDFAGAQAMSDRMRKIIDPKILDEELDPQVMALQSQNEQMQQGIQALQGQISQLQQQLVDKQQEIEIKARAEKFDNDADLRKHQIEIAKLRLDEQKTAGDLALRKQELELKAYEAGLKTSKAAMEQRESTLNEVAQFSADVNGRGLYD
jgi:hypothetical protein